MAIDTAQKRASAATVVNPWNGPSIIPDGSLGQADRQQVGWSYSGIFAVAPYEFLLLTTGDQRYALAGQSGARYSTVPQSAQRYTPESAGKPRYGVTDQSEPKYGVDSA